VTLSLFPVNIAAVLERLMKEFLWKGTREGSGDNLVKWDIVIKPKMFRGLGIENLVKGNTTMLGKYL
jgi:hypothetical protein